MEDKNISIGDKVYVDMVGEVIGMEKNCVGVTIYKIWLDKGKYGLLSHCERSMISQVPTPENIQ